MYPFHWSQTPPGRPSLRFHGVPEYRYYVITPFPQRKDVLSFVYLLTHTSYMYQLSIPRSIDVCLDFFRHTQSQKSYIYSRTPYTGFGMDTRDNHVVARVLCPQRAGRSSWCPCRAATAHPKPAGLCPESQTHRSRLKRLPSPPTRSTSTNHQGKNAEGFFLMQPGPRTWSGRSLLLIPHCRCLEV